MGTTTGSVVVFLTRDPIGYADGPNVYCYVHCNPITHFDPLGLEDFIVLPTEESVMERIKATDNQQEKEAIATAWQTATKIATTRSEKDENVLVVSAADISDAKEQVLKHQGNGVPVDSITFDGGHGAPGEAQFGKDDINKETMSDFFSADANGNKISIEENGYTRFEFCVTGRGKEGDSFLSHVAGESGRRAIGYTALIKDRVLPNPFGEGAFWYSRNAYGGKSSFGGYERNTKKLGPAYKYEKHVDPGGKPVRYKNHKEPYLANDMYPVN